MPAGRPRWLSMVMLVGVVYGVVGITTGTLAGMTASSRAQFLWRLSAFVIGGVVFAVHIGHEHFRLRSPARTTAWHTSLAIALGAFVVALVANIHDLGSASGYRPRMLIALVAWPLGTGLPAFIVALVLAGLLRLTARRT